MPWFCANPMSACTFTPIEAVSTTMEFEKEFQVYQDNLSKPLCRTHYRKVNPFRGLEFFDSEHAPFFHGRTKTVGELLNVLQQQAAAKRPFVLVLGPDGCGK